MNKQKDARRYSIVVRLHKDEKRALRKIARKAKITVGELVRKLFYDAHPPLEW